MGKITPSAYTETQIAALIEHARKSAIGPGKRFADEAALQQALKAACAHFSGDMSTLNLPDDGKHIAILAGTLGLSGEKIIELRTAINGFLEQTRGITNGLSTDPADNALTAWTVEKFVDTLPETHVTRKPPAIPPSPLPVVVRERKPPAATPSQRPAPVAAPRPMNHHPSPPPPKKITAPAISRSNLPPTPPGPRIKATPLPKKEAAVAPKPLSLETAFPEGYRGKDLLAYARRSGLTIGQILGEALQRLNGGCRRHVAGKELAELLEITPAQYGKFVRDEHSCPPLDLMNTLAKKLGATGEEDTIEWRKLMLGIPTKRNQRMLDLCFDREAKWTIPDSHGRPFTIQRVIIDTHATGEKRRTEFTKFINLLKDRHGYVDLGQLTEAILPTPTPEGISSRRLQHALLQVMDGYSNRLNPNHYKTAIAALAAYAFPGEQAQALRDQCADFLSSERHLPTHAPGYTPPYKKEFRGLVFPENLTGDKLLAYCRARKLTFGDLLRNMHDLSEGNLDDFLGEIGIRSAQFRTWLEKKSPEMILLSQMDAIAVKLGAVTAEDKTKWRQFMHHIDPEYNQDRLDQFFTNTAQDKTSTPREFFDLLKQVHGIPTLTQLAALIATQDNTINQKGLETAMHNVTTQSTMAPRYAAVIAKFSFPKDEQEPLRKQCLTLLLSPRRLKKSPPSSWIESAAATSPDSCARC